MKKLISLALLLFLLLNMAACFDADDIFRNEEGTEKSTDKVTEAPPTDVPTEEPTEEPTEKEDTLIPYEEEPFVLSFPVNNEPLPKETLNLLSSIVGLTPRANENGEKGAKSQWIGVLDFEYGLIKSAYTYSSFGFGNEFSMILGREKDTYVEGRHMSMYQNIFALDGSELTNGSEDSVYVLMGFRRGGTDPLFRRVFADVSDGELRLDLDITHYNCTDDSVNESVLVLELDKTQLTADQSFDVSVEFNQSFFDFIIKGQGEEKDKNIFGFFLDSGYAYRLDAILGDNSAWEDKTDEPDVNYVNIEIVETKCIGYPTEKQKYYGIGLYEPTGESRTIKYSYSLGIILEGDRFLQLSPEENAYMKSLID